MATLVRNLVSKSPCLLRPLGVLNVSSCRGKKVWRRKVDKDLYNRRIEQGPEPERQRSEWSNWNYSAELYSFGKRLREDLSENTLRTAFTHRSYIEQEEAKRRELGVGEDTTPLGLQDNDELAKQGWAVASAYVRAYLRHCLPAWPEEGISALHDHLMSEETLSHVGSNLGVKDLILSQDFPPEESTLSKTLKAVIGALARDQGPDRAHLFVQDFICVQLVGKDIHELWKVTDPMGTLAQVLAKQGRAAPEPRLLMQMGQSTIMSAYMVGIYCDKKLIGKGYGETVSIAEEMAAHEALSSIVGLPRHAHPFKFGQAGHAMELDLNKLNPTLSDMGVLGRLQ